MAVFGLTGGIGTGKSTVCDMLREHVKTLAATLHEVAATTA